MTTISAKEFYEAIDNEACGSGSSSFDECWSRVHSMYKQELGPDFEPPYDEEMEKELRLAIEDAGPEYEDE